MVVFLYNCIYKSRLKGGLGYSLQSLDEDGDDGNDDDVDITDQLLYQSLYILPL